MIEEAALALLGAREAQATKASFQWWEILEFIMKSSEIVPCAIAESTSRGPFAGVWRLDSHTTSY